MAIKITGEYLTPEEAALELGLSVNSVRRYCNDNENPKLNAEKLGRDWLIPRKEVERYKRERKSPGQPRKHNV